MSVEQTIGLDASLFGRTERWRARVVVMAARALSRRPPRRIRQILRVVARGARPATYAEAARARALVTNTSWTCTGPRGCLPRAIATALVCRSHGTFPTWVVGVRATPPFGAHAWVMAEGRDVEEPYPVGYHVVLLRVDPMAGTR